MLIDCEDIHEIWDGNHEINFEPGINVLVGHNGSGKSTTLHLISDYCHNNNIEYIDVDNFNDGGHNFGSLLGFRSSTRDFANFALSSEGEKIVRFLGDAASRIGRAMTKVYKSDNKKIVITFDAIDSGLDIANMQYIKRDLFDLVLEDAKSRDIEVYIILTTNAYEFVKIGQCFNVKTGERISFKSYEEYADWIVQEANYA